MPIPSTVPILQFVAIFLVALAVASLLRGFFGSRFNDVGRGLVDEMVAADESEQARTTGAGAHFPIRGAVDRRGVFFAEHSGLIVVYEIQPVGGDGVSPEEGERCAAMLERQLVRLPDDFTVNWWMDRGLAAAPESLLELPAHYQGDSLGEEARRSKPVLEALLDSRREMLLDGREFRNRFLVALEYRGNFAFGGIDVSWPDGLASGWRALRAKDPEKRREELMKFKSLWPGSDTAITNLLWSRCQEDVERVLREGRRFFDVLTAEIRPQLVSQAGADPAYGLTYRQLDVEEGARAFEQLLDPNPRRQKLFEFKPEDWGRIPSKLFEPTVDFGALYGKRTQDGRVVYPGMFTVGGVPRKIYSIRQMAEEIRPRMLGFLQDFPHMVVYRVRWQSLSPEAARAEVEQLQRQVAEGQMNFKVQRKDASGKGQVTGEDKRTVAEAEEMEDKTSEGRKFGHLTILVALSGWPGKDARGRAISAEEDLEKACERLETRFRALDITWAEEIDHQDVAFLSLFPGKVTFQELETLKCHSDVAASLMPIFDSFVPQPKITEMEPKAPFMLTVGRSGRHEMRSLISGKTCMALVLGEMGGGKSYFLNEATQGWKMVDPAAQVDVIEAGASLAVTALASGGAVLRLGDPKLQPRLNPFDRSIGNGGYQPEVKNELAQFAEACIGKDDYTGEEKSVLMEAIDQTGKRQVYDGSGVRSLTTLVGHLEGLGDMGRGLAMELSEFTMRDSQKPGRYAWLFPAVPNAADAGYVDYTFPVQTFDARAEALQVFAIIQRVKSRVDGRHPHLLVLDEANRFLSLAGTNEYKRAAAKALARLLSDALTQWRKLGSGLVICTQFPGHLKSWDEELVKNLRGSLGTWIILPMRAEALKEMDVLLDEGTAKPVIEAVSRLSPSDYEYVQVQRGIPQILRLDEGWMGQSMNESAATASLAKNWIQENFPGTQLGKIKAFERALREVRAGHLEWRQVLEQCEEGRWSA